MKSKYFLIIIVLGLLSICWFIQKNQSVVDLPIPTNGNTIVKEGAEEGDNQTLRENWFKLMHSSAPETNWKAIEYQTSMNRHLKRANARSNAKNRGGNEILANENLTGQWNERGSINQAGSVFVTEYLPETNELYLISAGGTLFRGTREGNDWNVVNQDLRFENNFLERIKIGDNDRFLATITDIPHFSDDGGYTWTPASGIPVDDSNARSLYPIVIEDGVNNVVYLMSKKSYWEDYNIYKSEDNGETYSLIINLNDSNTSNFSMVRPHHSDEIYLIEKNSAWSTSLHRINQTTEELELLNQNSGFGFGSTGSNMAATQIDSITRFIVYNANSEVYQSEDFGETWTLNGQMPSAPWNVGIFISPRDPDFMLYGDIECYKSADAGENWFKINGWGAYYSDVNSSLHADMMHFNEFKTSTGETFMLSSNHGGLNITDSLFNNISNLGLTNLNVSQYYDVVTDPIDPVYIYAGSQDQGFQRGISFDNEEVINFDQVISGDYGHIVFSQEGQRMWTVYPGGWVTLYNFPQTSGISASWEVNSDNETVWIPPLMASPDPNENAVYLAGGNMDGGTGSYLIKLTYNDLINEIEPTQIDYDFMDYSAGGTISMMRTSPLNSDHWYVSTTNGRFFFSYDGGITWDQSIQFVPGGHYLYGAAIYPSKLDANTVYFAGSGYSNPAVYKSTDGGQNFEAINAGMPETLVFELAANEDESLIFAATEAGPYVYVVEEALWYDMSGMAAPNQTYWSVEYIESLQIIRFGTYGRGIWDFQIQDEVSTSQPITNNERLSIAPNPSSDFVRLTLAEVLSDQIIFELRDITGKIVSSQSFDVQKGSELNTSISLKSYAKGVYIITLRDGNHIMSKQVVIQ